MKTYSFADKNSSCVMIVSADTDEEALEELKDKVKFPDSWRMEIIEDGDGDGDNTIL